METVEATIHYEINVECPECEAYLNILDPFKVNGDNHNDENELMIQLNGDQDYGDFECDEVTCGQCQCTFNVKGIEVMI